MKDNWEKERNEALWSLDEAKIRAYQEKWEVNDHTTGEAWWDGVYLAIWNIKATSPALRYKVGCELWKRGWYADSSEPLGWRRYR